MDLIATCWTIGGDLRPDLGRDMSPFPLEERLRAAAAAGYQGVGLWVGDLAQWRAAHGYASLRRIISEEGFGAVELEYLADWYTEGERRARSDAAKAELLRAAAELGARHIKVVPPFDGVLRPLAQLVDSFGALCEEARQAGAKVALEMIPFSDLPTLDAALELIAAVDAPNGGLLIDIWHVARSGADFDDLARIPGRYILAAELNDANREVEGDLAEDSMRRRKLCGEGAFEISRFLARMAEAGYRGPYGVEILSDELRHASPSVAARRSYETARAEIDRFKRLV